MFQSLQGDGSLSRRIPVPVIAIVSDVLATRYSHSRIDYFMEAAGIECDSPPGNNVDKTRAWFRFANESKPDPLATLGKVITELMEANTSGYASDTDLDPEREKVNKVLSEHGLSYMKLPAMPHPLVKLPAATLQSLMAATSPQLAQRLPAEHCQDIINARDLPGLQTEFDRSLDNVESDPASAVTASCALLESLFKN
jgi:hypothetical protein